MFNPFYQIIKADDIPDDEVADLFVNSVCSPWAEVENPVNHIVWGPRGSGKTILLKQLSYKSASQRYSQNPPYIGVYIQISRLSSIFRDLFRSAMDIHNHVDVSATYQGVFADYLCLELVKELCTALNAYAKTFSFPLMPSDLEGLSDSAGAFATYQDLIAFCRGTQKTIEGGFKRWQVQQNCDWEQRFNIISSPQRIAEAAVDFCQRASGNRLKLYILLDESCPIPVECQQVINALLHRGRLFNVKVVVRPFEWTSFQTNSGLTIEREVDFRSLFIEYPDELSDTYAKQMRMIANQALKTRIVKKVPPPQGWFEARDITIDDIFPHSNKTSAGAYSGFDDFCALSSGIPQDLLSLCSAVFALADRTKRLQQGKTPSISADLQSECVKAWSKEVEAGISDAGTRSLCKAFLRKIGAAKDKSISFRVDLGDSNLLIRASHLPDDLAKLLKPAFGTGLLRGFAGDRDIVAQVPVQFRISRTLLPSGSLLLRLPTSPTMIVHPKFLKQHAKERNGGSTQSRLEGVSGKEINAFLSTSFSAVALEERRSIKQALERVQISCKDLDERAKGQQLYTAVRRAVEENQITVLNATEPKPFTLFEVGLSAGLEKPKPVICVFNDNGDPSSVERLPSFLRKLPVITYNLSPESLAKMASQVRREAEYLLSSPNEFEVEAVSGIRLRIKRRTQRTVYVSHPDDAVWSQALTAIDDALRKQRWRLVSDKDAGIYQASVLQIAIRCASLASVCVVDTSGEDCPDLLQSYKLGVCYADKDRPPLQIEKVGNAHKTVFDCLPGDYNTWSSVPNVADIVAQFVRGASKQGKRR